ncbi:hypothetical protein GBF38_001499 [Nibea albiflora]|uniref:Uncharacterized protein n=1 Tax=Nibea albiflora TaxID=240163 RepID=A0ACB7EUQ7_NIBAL|nr:hypothetical protein GBF38_001499 [Nibea albiflora]
MLYSNRNIRGCEVKASAGWLQNKSVSVNKVKARSRRALFTLRSFLGPCALTPPELLPAASCPSALGAMVAAVLKLYFIGTALSVLAVLFEIVDSFGGLMFVQEDRNYVRELEQQEKTQRPVCPCDHQRGSSVTKHIGS